ncbi:GntR family transcriptional regulator [Pseudomonas sp. ISL-88]|uniref:GntR family transcriptional regulator n=1 Tax=Pseudomonas sp. ISL-88 TaxID=2819169 RepID=UPI002570B81E|nr:GntR family transcriptional regulator [Pseudomonas sp. ISL-88]
MNKYERIANEMRTRIKSNRYAIDQPIPDELTLAEEFGCSRMTMKRALDTLAAEGLLFRKRGHGTFIIQSAMQDEHVHVVSNEILGLSNLLKDKDVKSRVIRFEVQFPSQEVAAHLAINEKTPVYYVVRLRIVEGEPYVLEKTYMPASLIPGINDEVLNHSIYDHITNGLHLKIAGTHRKIRACKSDQMDQQYLGCQSDDPILEVELR